MGCRRIKTIAITSRIEGNKKNPFLYSLTKLKHSLLTLHSGMRHFTMHRRTLSSGLLLFRSKGGKTEGAFNEGLPGFLGTREHWQNIEGNISQFWGTGNKISKNYSTKHSERVWEHGNIGQFWKGTREQGPPLGDPLQFLRSEQSD